MNIYKVDFSESSINNCFCRWFKTARRLMHKNSSKDDLSLPSSNFPRPTSGQPQFSTRTRLRPGGPMASGMTARQHHSSTLRNGSMPSVAGGFEEIAMRTLNRPTQPLTWVGVQDHNFSLAESKKIPEAAV